MKSKTKLLLSLTSIILLAECKQAERGSVEHIKTVASAIDDNRLINADKTSGDWLSYAAIMENRHNRKSR